MTRANRERVEARLMQRSDALRARAPRSRVRMAEPAADPAPQASASTCIECGGRILAARLAVVPGAERCIGCQRDFERAG